MLAFLLIAGAGWLWYCNHKTYLDRQPIKYPVWREVTYNKHLWYRLTFRDPMKLYDFR